MSPKRRKDALSVQSLTLVFALWVTMLQGCAGAASSRAGVELSPDAARFQMYVTQLADPSMEGRGPGTAGHDRARDYIASAFERIGLEPVFAGSYLQPFDMKLDVRVDRQKLALADADGSVVSDLQPTTQFTVMGFSASGDFAGEAVFVGYSIVDAQRGYDSFGPHGHEMLAGKVAVAFRYEPHDGQGNSLWAGTLGQRHGRWTEAAALSQKAQVAAAHCATALLVVNPPVHDPPQGGLRATRYSITGADASIPVMHISSDLFRRMLRRSGRTEASIFELEKQANAGTLEPQRLDGVFMRGEVKLMHPTTRVANVAGMIPGSGRLADEILVIGAHYDHLGYGEVGSFIDERVIHPGADDNASGIAAMLMLAQRMTQRERAGDQRTVIFIAFSGEERGLLGSAHFIKDLESIALCTDRIVAMLNMDMVGRMRDRMLWVMGVKTGDRWDAIVLRAAAGLDVKVQTESTGSGASDHANFYYQNIPVLHVFTGVHEDYHRPSDTAKLINAAGGAIVVDLVDRIARQLIDEPQRIAFQSDNVDPHAMAGLGVGSGFRAMLGIVPDYTMMDGDDGCGVQGVRPDSPAAKAGLRTGDVIVKWNDAPVANLRAYTQLLRESEPGEKVTLQVRRGDEQVELHATLGER